MPQTPYHQIRAHFNRETIVLYQAYNSAIAEAAVKAQKFVEPFSLNRATWIKPSFLWLMERSGWGKKANQERTLAVRITRKGWEEALGCAVLTHAEQKLYGDQENWRREMEKAPVIVQWDPERSLRGAKLEHRSIQVGLRRAIVERFVNHWTVAIEDLTPLVSKMNKLRKSGDYTKLKRLLPPEKPYPLPADIADRLTC